jgi:FlaA1/EpsC-like NDP-sugar epimerase
MTSDSSHRNLFITGATGNVGFEVIKQISAHEDGNIRLI